MYVDSLKTKMSKKKGNVKNNGEEDRKKVKSVNVKTKISAELCSDTNKIKAKKYLKRWHKDRNSWKFEKVLQIWLIKHMFDQSQVKEKTFDIFVKYISASKGQVLQRIKDNCQEIIQSMKQWTEQKQAGLSEDEIVSKYPHLQQIEEEKYQRARRILQSIKDTESEK